MQNTPPSRSPSGDSASDSSRSPLGYILLAALIAGGVFWATRKSSSVQENSQETITQPNLKILEFAIESFEVDNGRYPTSAEGLNALMTQPANAPNWHGPYLKSVPRDPWGVAYLYESPGTHNPGTFDVWSAGPDKTPDTSDDIGNW